MRLGRARHPVPRRHQLSRSSHRETLAGWVAADGPAGRRPSGSSPALSAVGRLHGRAPPRRGRCSSSAADGRAPRVRRAAAPVAPTRPMPRRPGSVAAVVIGDAGRRPVVPEPRHRLPAHPRRGRAARHAPQPVVADAARARRSMPARSSPASSSRPGQRARDPRQAVAGRLPAGRRRPAPRPRRPRAARRDFAMVGDDPAADVAAAQRVGLRGVLVLTGKTRPATRSDRGAREPRRPRGPDAVAASLADVVAALD